jgi:hypothetical protein
MCDYSLEHLASRDAKASDVLITTRFSLTTGFSAVGQPNVAVCLRPGTELAFDHDVIYETSAVFFGKRQLAARVARFRQVNTATPHAHHDALEFPDGKVVLLTHLAEGQTATVLQTPSTGLHQDDHAGETQTASVSEQPRTPVEVR